MNKMKIYKIILLVLILAIIIVLSLITIKVVKSNINEKNLKETVAQIYAQEELTPVSEEDNSENTISAIDEIDMDIKGNKVVGIIKIPKIGLEYPILEKTTVDTLNLSITKFWGNKINEIGNVTLAGHNMLNGTMFGKVKDLQEGDIIELTDIQKVTLKYKIYKIYVTDPNDISCILPEKENVREITLITCTNGNKNRLIVKAIEI